MSIPGYEFSKTARKSQRKLVPLYTIVPAAELERIRWEIEGQIARQTQPGAGLRLMKEMESRGPVMRAYTPGRNERPISTNWDRNADLRKALAKSRAKAQNTGSRWNWDWLKFPTNNTHKYIQFDSNAPGTPTQSGHSNVGEDVRTKTRAAETPAQTKAREAKEIEVGGRHVRNIGVMIGRAPIEMLYDIPIAASYGLQWGLYPLSNAHPEYLKSWQDYRARKLMERDQVMGLLKYDPNTPESHKQYYGWGTTALNFGGSIALGEFGPKVISAATKLPNIYKTQKLWHPAVNYMFPSTQAVKAALKSIPAKAMGWEGDVGIIAGGIGDSLTTPIR